MTQEVLLQPYTVVEDDVAVWQQGNMLAGDTGWTSNPEGWEANLDKALAHLGQFTAAKEVVSVSAAKPGVDLIDMDRSPQPFGRHLRLRTQGIITSDQSHVLLVNPGDCGQIAVSGITPDERPVIGLFHGSRHEIDRRSYLPSLEYLCDSRKLSPEELTVRISPSARMESYAFPNIAEEQKTSERWAGYTEQDEQGSWHVDLHGRMLADLVGFGISTDRMMISPDDTAHIDSPYFSHSQSVRGLKPMGAMVCCSRCGLRQL